MKTSTRLALGATVILFIVAIYEIFTARYSDDFFVLLFVGLPGIWLLKFILSLPMDKKVATEDVYRNQLKRDHHQAISIISVKTPSSDHLFSN